MLIFSRVSYMVILKDGIFILIAAAFLCLWGIFYCVYRDYKTKRLSIGDKFIYPSREIAYKEACRLQKHKYVVSVKEVDLDYKRNIEKAIGYKPFWENCNAPDKIIYGAYYKKYRKESLKYLKNRGYNLLVAGEKSNYDEYYPDFEYNYDFNKYLPRIDTYWLVTICDDETRYL